MTRLGICLAAMLAVPAGMARGQTAVQLPTFSHFGVGTTVSVPDRGTALMGGVSRAASGRNEFGMPASPFRNQAFGSERSASNVSVSVYIHDFEAMDQYLLSQPTASSASRLARSGARPTPVATEESPPPRKSLDDLKAEFAQQAKVRAQEAEEYFHRGQSAEAAGKAGVAKIYYQMAARRATGPLKDEVAARLQQLQTPSPAATRLAQGQR